MFLKISKCRLDRFRYRKLLNFIWKSSIWNWTTSVSTTEVFFFLLRISEWLSWNSSPWELPLLGKQTQPEGVGPSDGWYKSGQFLFQWSEWICYNAEKSDVRVKSVKTITLGEHHNTFPKVKIHNSREEKWESLIFLPSKDNQCWYFVKFPSWGSFSVFLFCFILTKQNKTLPHTLYQKKVNSRWILDLHVKSKTMSF